MIMKDFECDACGHIFEELTPATNELKLAEGQDWGWKDVTCPACGECSAKEIFNGSSALWCEQTIPTYPGCKKQKAGYTHTSHADQKATKLQSGYGGCQSLPV